MSSSSPSKSDALCTTTDSVLLRLPANKAQVFERIMTGNSGDSQQYPDIITTIGFEKQQQQQVETNHHTQQDTSTSKMDALPTSTPSVHMAGTGITPSVRSLVSDPILVDHDASSVSNSPRSATSSPSTRANRHHGTSTTTTTTTAPAPANASTSSPSLVDSQADTRIDSRNGMISPPRRQGNTNTFNEHRTNGIDITPPSISTTPSHAGLLPISSHKRKPAYPSPYPSTTVPVLSTTTNPSSSASSSSSPPSSSFATFNTTSTNVLLSNGSPPKKSKTSPTQPDAPSSTNISYKDVSSHVRPIGLDEDGNKENMNENSWGSSETNSKKKEQNDIKAYFSTIVRNL